MKWMMLALLFPSVLLAVRPDHGVPGQVTSFTAVMGDPMRPPPFALRQYRRERRAKQTPALSASRKPARKKQWVLNSILYAPGRKRAIINGRLRAVGERINGARLVAIERDRVRLSSQGQILMLRLEKARIILEKNRKR